MAEPRVQSAAGQVGDGPPPGSLRGVIFDFDGVILESATIKTEAFRELFAHHAEHLPAILSHHQEHLGVSRFEKFRWIYRELLGRELDAETSRRLGERFAELALEKTLDCPLVPGARRTLERLHAAAVPCFVASGTPQEELELIVEQRGLRRYFVEVRGAPASKAGIIRDLAERHRLAPRALLLVGDGHSDYRAALDTGIWFAARVTPQQEGLFDGVEVPRFADLTELLQPLDGWLAAASDRGTQAGRAS